MGKNSGIAWTDHTFNPWHGCVEVSEACDNCYAREWDARFINPEGSQPTMREAHWGKTAPRRFFGEAHWREPLRWNKEAGSTGKRTLVFCASMADVFESDREDLLTPRQMLFDLIEKTSNLTWLLLTKRPHNIKKMLRPSLVGAANIWLGTTVESPAYLWRAERLVEHSLAHVRFVSMEPLLESVNIAPYLSKANEPGIDWVIAGCESGTNSRITSADAYRDLRDSCKDRDVPFFLKQAREATGVTSGATSSKKHTPEGLLIDRPSLDGVQHVEFPK